MLLKQDLSDLLKLIHADDLKAIQQAPALAAAVQATDCRGSTALHMAAQLGKDSIVDELILAGAEVDAVNSEGDTPLCVAALYSKASTVQLLLDAGADPCKVNIRRDTTPLVMAAGVSSVAVVGCLAETLQKAGISLGFTHGSGGTASMKQ
jgi:ankyrin repeat protein